MLTRRLFLLSASTAALVVNLPEAILPAEAWTHGSSIDQNAPTQRSIFNMDFTSVGEYIFIDYINFGMGVGSSGLITNGFSTPGGPYWTQVNFDPVYGWPKDQLTGGNTYSVGMILPSPEVVNQGTFAGREYTFDGTGEGNGQIVIPFGCTISAFGNKTANFTDQGGGQFLISADNGSRWSATISIGYGTYAGTAGLPASLVIRGNNPNSNGKWIGFNGAPRFYETRYASNLAAGEIVRPAYKQNIAAYNPGAIRFMNWCGGNLGANGDYSCRWSNRTKPQYPGNINNFASPPYSQISLIGATPNAFQLDPGGVTGMPVTYQHGEVVTFLCSSAPTSRDSNAFNIGSVINITNAANGICNWTAHPWLTGDVLYWNCPFNMLNLAGCHGTVTKIDADHFSIGIDTTSGGSWTTGTNGSVHEYVTLNVGNRGNIPVVGSDGSSQLFFDGGWTVGNYYTLYFNKNLANNKTVLAPPPTQPNDPAAHYTYGVWCSVSGGSTGQNFATGSIPLEKIVAIINEINAQYTTQGPTHLYLNCPMYAMMSVDPDYTSGENLVVNMIDTVLNGSTQNGRVYPGLNSKCYVYFEYNNETWNLGSFAVTQRLGYFRGLVDFSNQDNNYPTLRSGVMATDIRNAGLGSRVRFVQGTQFAGGFGTAGSPSGSYERFYGSQLQGADPYNNWGQQAVFTGETFPFAPPLNSAAQLTVTAITSGTIQIGQWVAWDYANTPVSGNRAGGWGFIKRQISGTPGGVGVYELDRSATNLLQLASFSQTLYSQFVPGDKIFDYLSGAPYVQPYVYWDVDECQVPGGGSGIAALAAYWAANSGNPTNQSAAIDAYLLGYINDPNAAGGGSSYVTDDLNFWLNQISNFATNFGYIGAFTGKTKYIMAYEGGMQINFNGGFLDRSNNLHSYTTQEQQFLYACHNSTNWAIAWVNFLNSWSATIVSGARGALPGEYTRSETEWGHILPPNNNGLGAYDCHLVGTNQEYGNLDAAWTQTGTRNNGLPV